MQKQFSDAVKRYLDSQGLKYRFDEKQGVLAMGIAGQNIPAIDIKMLFHDDGFEIYAQPRFCVPRGKRAEAAEFMTRSNYGSRIGGLEMDWDTGEIFSRVYILPQSEVPSNECIMAACSYGMLLLDAHGKGLNALVYGSASVQEALRLNCAG